MFDRYRFFLQSIMMMGLISVPLVSFADQRECQINKSTPILDYGHLKYDGGIQSGKKIVFKEATTYITVTCQSSGGVVLYFESDSPTGDEFRFGEGKLRVRVSSGMVDDRPVQVARFDKNGQPANELFILSGDGIEPRTGVISEKGKTFSLSVSVEPTLPLRALSVRDVDNIESQIRMRIVTY